MKLELCKIVVDKLGMGTTHKREGQGSDHQQGDELVAKILEDPGLKGVEVELVHPGESTRILPVKDAVQPRYKLEGPGQVFPGWIGGCGNRWLRQNPGS